VSSVLRSDTPGRRVVDRLGIKTIRPGLTEIRTGVGLFSILDARFSLRLVAD